MPQQGHDDDSCGNARHKRADAGACGAHAKAVNKHGIYCNVDDVYNKRAEHGHIAVAHGAKQRRACIVNAHQGVGCGREQKVDKRAVHHILFHMPEQKCEDVLPEYEGASHQKHGHSRHGV